MLAATTLRAESAEEEQVLTQMQKDAAQKLETMRKEKRIQALLNDDNLVGFQAEVKTKPTSFFSAALEAGAINIVKWMMNINEDLGRPRGRTDYTGDYSLLSNPLEDAIVGGLEVVKHLISQHPSSFHVRTDRVWDVLADIVLGTKKGAWVPDLKTSREMAQFLHNNGVVLKQDRDTRCEHPLSRAVTMRHNIGIHVFTPYMYENMISKTPQCEFLLRIVPRTEKECQAWDVLADRLLSKKYVFTYFWLVSRAQNRHAFQKLLKWIDED